MRTTIELPKDQRAELLKLAAKRGMKGFSQIIQEALNEYLIRQNSREDLVRAAMGLKGTVTGKLADEFEERIKAIRSDWR